MLLAIRTLKLASTNEQDDLLDKEIVLLFNPFIFVYSIENINEYSGCLPSWTSTSTSS